jgi:hypothetical protein
VLPPANEEACPERLAGGVNDRGAALPLLPGVSALADGVRSPARLVLAAGGVNERHPGRALDCELPAILERFVAVPEASLEAWAAPEL